MRRTAPRPDRRRSPARADSAPRRPRSIGARHQPRAIPRTASARRAPAVSAAAEFARRSRAAAPSSAPSACSYRLLDETLALDEFERDVLPGLLLLDQIGAPALEMVGPGLDRVAPAPDPVRPETRHPAVVVEERKRRLPPVLVLEARISGPRAILSWPSRKMSAQTVDLVADHPLDRIAAGIDLGPDILDQDARLGPPFRAMSGVAADIRAWRDRHLPHRTRRAHARRAHRAARRGSAPAPASPRPPASASASTRLVLDPVSPAADSSPCRTTSRGSRSCVLTKDQRAVGRRSRSAAAARAADRRAATGGAAAPPR